jgi:hypothetical protein
MTYYSLDINAYCGIIPTESRIDMPRKSPFLIVLTKTEKTHLEKMAQKYTAPYFSVVRAKIVLLAAQGLSNDQIAARVDMPRQIVSKWRKKFFEKRLAGLADDPRSGRPARFSPQNRSGG